LNQLPATIQGTTLIDQHFEFGAASLKIVGRPTFEQWAEMFETLKAMEKAIQFWLGDLLNYGEHAYGEKYSQFLEYRAYSTLATYSWVARQIPSSERVEKLTFEHHRCVAHLPSPDQSQWLSRAEDEGWSTRRLASEIATENDEPFPPRTFYNGLGQADGGPHRWVVRLPVGQALDMKAGQVHIVVREKP